MAFWEFDVKNRSSKKRFDQGVLVTKAEKSSKTSPEKELEPQLCIGGLLEFQQGK